MTLAIYNSPLDVVRHPQLEPEVKRAILASWASDANAIENRPELRRPPEIARTLRLDEVMDALRDLDAGSS